MDKSQGAAVHLDDDDQDLAGVCTECARRGRREGSRIMRSGQHDGALVMSVCRCYFDVYSRRADVGSGQYGE